MSTDVSSILHTHLTCLKFQIHIEGRGFSSQFHITVRFPPQ